MRIFVTLLLISVFGPLPIAQAMKVKTLRVKKKAAFEQQANGLFTPLDLKEKQLTFTAADLGQCGHVLQRKLGTLSYSCKLEVPGNSKGRKLKEILSPTKILVRFGRNEKLVSVKVSKDAKYILFRTEFDATGLDLEMSRFNDDFHGIYAKSAHLVISEAMSQHPLRIRVVE
jgi:hypothetical protein